MKRVLILILCLSFPFYQVWSQSLKGKVIDATTEEALPFANIVVLQAADSSFIGGTVSKEDGTFSMEMPEGKQLLRVSLIGYKTYTAPLKKQNLGSIALTPKQEMLSEVVVTGRAKLFKLENGGLTADIQNTPLKEMGNLSEVLGQMPFVTKTDNSFTVLGKGTPIFYINNRLVRDNNDLLRIDSRDIKKVTVITNPGAEYDASVNAVIRVETFRPVGEGLSIDLWTYNRYNSKWYTQDRATLNYRKEKLDVFVSFSYANMAFPKDRIRTNTIETEEGTRTVFARTKDSDMWKFRTPQGGFNYMVNENHSFGARYEYFNTFNKKYDYSIDTETTFQNQQDAPVHTQTTGDSEEHSHYINAYYNGKANDWLNIKWDMDYKTSKNNGYSGAVNTTDNENQGNFRTDNKAQYDLYAGKLTLEIPLWGGNLVYGGEGSHTHNEQSNAIEENTGIPGIYSSTNEVTQNLYAGFLSYNRSLGAFSGNLGVRYENVSSDYFQDGKLVDEQSKRHQRWFPSFRVSYNGPKDLRMELAYRNSVARPSYHSLRSSIGYLGPYSYGSGNPLLQPSYTNSLTYMLSWKQFTFMGVYNKSKDYIAEISELYINNSVLIKDANIDKARFLTLSLNYNSAFGIWRPNWDVSFDKNYITYGNPGITYNKPIFSANFRNGFSIKGWNFGLDLQARTKGHDRYLSYREEASWSANIYVNTSFFKNQLLVGLQGNDIFNTYSDNISYRFNHLDSYWANSMYRRVFVFSFTYRFNASQQRYKGSNATDELRRL